jgi:hypothetical protein
MSSAKLWAASRRSLRQPQLLPRLFRSQHRSLSSGPVWSDSLRSLVAGSALINSCARSKREPELAPVCFLTSVIYHCSRSSSVQKAGPMDPYHAVTWASGAIEQIVLHHRKHRNRGRDFRAAEECSRRLRMGKLFLFYAKICIVPVAWR